MAGGAQLLGHFICHDSAETVTAKEKGAVRLDFENRARIAGSDFLDCPERECLRRRAERLEPINWPFLAKELCERSKEIHSALATVYAEEWRPRSAGVKYNARRPGAGRLQSSEPCGDLFDRRRFKQQPGRNVLAERSLDACEHPRDHQRV